MSSYIYNLGQLFSKTASEYKSKAAICFLNTSTVSYGELEILSNKIAHYLLTKQVKKGDVIAIFNEKNTTGYAIMLACLKLGITYTNLDAASPPERLKRMLHLCEPVFFFIPAKSVSLLNECGFDQTKIIEYTSDEFLADIDRCRDVFPTYNDSVTGNIPAYLMFTSGSTGFPKGVVITHSNVLNFIEWSRTTYDTTSNDIFTNINPLHFDNSVFDFYSSLFTGASIAPVTEELTKNPRQLLDSLNNVNPTIWFSVPSMLVYVLKMRALKETDLLSLRIVTFGGEGFPKNQLRNLWNLWGKRVKFINVYGPTECTCICSSYIVSEEDMKSDDLLPLGPIAPNFDFSILDSEMNQVKEGEIGELYISGPNVGLGYFNNPEKTKESFIQHPFTKAHLKIVYKSGDLVSYSNAKNLLYFCGRKDNQIKRMGYRIELEEIENALGALNYIEECAVIYNKSENDNGKIIACLRATLSDENKILADLTTLIPSYMLPNEFKFYDHLPKNQNGKIDRLKLKEEYQK